MAERPRKPLFPNPFYVVLLFSSTAFVVTALAYLVSGGQLDSPRAVEPGPASKAVAVWFDRHGPLTLGIEFVVMVISGFVAMATDHWFHPKATGGGPGPR